MLLSRNVVRPPQRVENFAAGEYPTSIRRQQIQQTLLQQGQVQLNDPVVHGSVQDVDLQLTQLDRGSEGHGITVGPPNDRNHPRQEFLRSEWDGQDVVRAGLEGGQLGRQIAAPRQGNRGQVRTRWYARADLVEDPAPLEVHVHQHQMRLPGEAQRMRTDAFQRAVRLSASLRHLVGRYTIALLNQTARGSACNRLHRVDQRLVIHDLADGDELPLTQEFLGFMLGVRRASVNQTAGVLQRAMLIDYRPGLITVLDRDGLERAACEDYAHARDEYERLLGDQGASLHARTWAEPNSGYGRVRL